MVFEPELFEPGLFEPELFDPRSDFESSSSSSDLVTEVSSASSLLSVISGISRSAESFPDSEPAEDSVEFRFPVSSNSDPDVTLSASFLSSSSSFRTVSGRVFSLGFS